ncbi:thiosulfate sulfurtransferase domain protein [Burkholderia pseudomallei]|nr:thiosulfate sulfurtransferase domain protein [Burkholderia pseudomallei]
MPRWPASSRSPSKPSSTLNTCVKPAFAAACAASAERLPLRQSSSTTASLPVFASSSRTKRGLRVRLVPVAQGTCRLSGT